MSVVALPVSSRSSGRVAVHADTKFASRRKSREQRWRRIYGKTVRHPRRLHAKPIDGAPMMYPLLGCRTDNSGGLVSDRGNSAVSSLAVFSSTIS